MSVVTTAPTGAGQPCENRALRRCDCTEVPTVQLVCIIHPLCVHSVGHTRVTRVSRRKRMSA
jgi:hypothetical protein